MALSFRFQGSVGRAVARGVAAIALLLSATAVPAAPILSVDVDPLTSGVQSTLAVRAGDLFAVDVVFSGLEATAPLSAFEFGLGFDGLLVTATTAVGGGFLPAPVLPVQILLGSFSVELAQTTLLPNVGATGTGVLATVTFEALSAGISLFELDDILLSAPFGVPIPVATEDLNGATVSVTIPEPQTVYLSLLALLLVLLTQRSRRSEFTGRGFFAIGSKGTE